ncbi:MAG: HRDC domain-containing protein, partial [Chloroflexota bacterium]|nr:HRDC domain-containing protein [Chloroflexota bacterium]
AECVLLYSGSDMVTHRFLASRDGQLSAERQRALDRQLREIGRFAVAPVCRHRLLTEHFGQAYEGPESGVWGLGSRVSGPGSGVPGLESGGSGPESEVSGPESEVSGPESEVSGPESGVSGPESGVRSPDSRVRGRESGSKPGARQLVAGTRPCGACDVCLGETQELPPEEALVTAHKVISAVWRTGGRYGAGHVMAVLLGRQTDMVERNQHDQLSVFGLLRDAGERAIRSWIDQLVVQGFLDFVERDQYTFLVMTAAGRDLCRIKENAAGLVRLGRYAAPKRSRGSGQSAVLGHYDRDLFERLRVLRRLIAEAQDVPPYVVFSDATLAELAAERPVILSDMLRVKGVGEAKLARYGRAFLAVINGASPGSAFGQEPRVAKAED